MSTFLGFDLSTQQLKILATNENLEHLCEVSVHFDSDLPEFKTKGGAIVSGDDNLTVTVPTLLWVKAIDLALNKLKQQNFDFKSVAAVSGTGQQHGSVYWKKGSQQILANLSPDKTLVEQLTDCFSVNNSPIWMDSSTTAECRRLEEEVGGALKVVEITGSRAYERFTGNQIRKIFTNQREQYENTERISLVSSFACSLLLGEYAAIDYSDGSGMNLLDIRTKCWSEECLKATADDAGKLKEKLGEPVSSSKVLGSISTYMVERFGFNPDCQIVAFTGDNPASLAGCRLQKGDAVVSLGTSDTLILWLDQPIPALAGHVFVNPVDDDAYMALLCFKNGSLTRERFRDLFTKDQTWEEFSSALQSTKPGNGGNLGFYFDAQEILPHAIGDHRFNSHDEKVTSFSDDDVNIRSCVEGQFIAKRYHAEKIGHKLAENSRILATGGASSNQQVLQVLSDVFQAPVYILGDTANSASLGCAYRAKHGLMKKKSNGKNFSDIFQQSPSYQLVCQPITYQYDMKRYNRLEDIVISSQSST